MSVRAKKPNHRDRRFFGCRKAHWKWNLFDTIVVFTQVADLGGSILPPIMAGRDGGTWSLPPEIHGGFRHETPMVF